MTQPTKPDGPLAEPIELDQDPGMIPVSILGKKFSVSPMEELRKMRKFAEPDMAGMPEATQKELDERGEVYLLAVRGYLKKEYGLDVSPDLCGAYHRQLTEANYAVMDFFGLTPSLPTNSASTPADSVPEQSGDGSQLSNNSEPSSHSEISLTPTPDPETNTASD